MSITRKTNWIFEFLNWKLWVRSINGAYKLFWWFKWKKINKREWIDKFKKKWIILKPVNSMPRRKDLNLK